MKKILTKKGFTLIELIVVIAILAILAAILIPSLTNYIKQANISKEQANARTNFSEVSLAFATGQTPVYLTGCSLGTAGDLDTFTCTFTVANGGTGYTYAASNEFKPTAPTAPTAP